MKTNSIITASLVLAISGLGASCSSDAKKTTNVSETPLKTSNTVSETMESHDAYYTVVEFERGSEGLSENNKKAIRAFMENAKKSGKEIDDIKVMAWADKEYPAKGSQIEKKDVRIADGRSESITRFLKKDLDADGDYESYNMAKRPNKISEFLKSDDFETKKTFEVSGSAPTSSSDQLATFMNNKAGKALIMVDYE